MPDSSFKINPSTYKQVLENAQRLNELAEKILDADPSTGGDVVNTDEGIKVIGLHVGTSNADVALGINEYKQGVTFEFKNVAVLNLTDLDGFVPGYCLLMTINKDSRVSGEADIDFTGFQIAFTNGDEYGQYRRNATGDTTWTDWMNLSGTSGGSGWLYGAEQPEDQDEGGYWCQPISEG